MEPRRVERGGGEPTVGGRAIVRARWGITIQDRGLASRPSCGSWGIVAGVNGVGCVGRLGKGRARATRANGRRRSGIGARVSGSRLMSGVAHPRPEYPVREPAHPKLGYTARGPAHPSPRQGRGTKGW